MEDVVRVVPVRAARKTLPCLDRSQGLAAVRARLLRRLGLDHVAHDPSLGGLERTPRFVTEEFHPEEGPSALEHGADAAFEVRRHLRRWLVVVHVTGAPLMSVAK